MLFVKQVICKNKCLMEIFDNKPTDPHVDLSFWNHCSTNFRQILNYNKLAHIVQNNCTSKELNAH